MPGPVTVVIATRNRPDMLRRAIRSVRESTLAQPIRTLVVFDQSEPDETLANDDPLRPVDVTTNTRTQGLAGARNTGVLLADTDWIAFLDDDDEWMPTKLEAQFAALAGTTDARLATCGVAIRYDDEDHIRLPQPASLGFEDFLADRMTEVHPSSFLIDRQWFVDDVGLVDEDLPGSYAEDYDVLLRAARLAPIATAPGALIRVWWHPSTYFRDRWTMIDDALGHLLAKYPEFNDVPSGHARILGQRAFAQAAAGDRRTAATTAVETLRTKPTEPRAWIALGVAAGIPPDKVLSTLHRFGRGL